MCERRDFKKRLQKKEPLSIHELIYPILQGYDSVIIHANIEIGGNDQKFNLNVARFLQKKINQIPQNIYTVPLLKGIDGIKKMSKTAKNTINFTENPTNFFGKLMKMPDHLVPEYSTLLLKNKITSQNYMIEKLNLATNLLTIFFGTQKAKKENNYFINCFCNKKKKNIKPTYKIILKEPQTLLNVLLKTQLKMSKKQIKRLFLQNSIKNENNEILQKYSLIKNTTKVFIGKKILVLIKKIYS
jgi:tyrosyl-tRNA synthetase